MKLLLLSLLTSILALPAPKEATPVESRCSEKHSLPGRKWQMQEMRFLYDNTQYYYKRDDEGSNINFDNDYIVFNCDGAGIYYQSDGTEYKLKWHFIKNKKNAIEFTISKFRYNSDLVVNWENIEFTNGSVKYTEYYTHKNGLHTLGLGVRTTTDPDKSGTDIVASSPASARKQN